MRWLDGITDSMDEFEQTLGDGEGQGSLACCSSWGRKESDTTEQQHLNKISTKETQHKVMKTDFSFKVKIKF